MIPPRGLFFRHEFSSCDPSIGSSFFTPGLLLFSPLETTGQEQKAGDSGSASPVIAKKLEEIVEIRRLQLNRQQALYSDDRISDVHGARIALARARVNLAREQKDWKKMANILAIQKLLFESSRIQEELGKGSSIEPKVALLQAEIDLERAKQEMQKE
ncbi:MAG: hypothetical protein P1U86_22660 [Verrucomicrobiales bacterium]|nr:hypothetical protein [Verrucomicrobiales bacterium]